MMAFSSDKGNKLSVLDGDDGRASLDSPQDIWQIDCTIRVFRSLVAWITHSQNIEPMASYITILISFYLKFK